MDIFSQLVMRFLVQTVPTLPLTPAGGSLALNQEVAVEELQHHQDQVLLNWASSQSW